MQVQEVMTTSVETIGPDSSLQEAAARMNTLDVGPLPVCERGRLVGMITDRDITVRAVAEGYGTSIGKVRDVMTPDLVYCYEDQDVSEAAELMQEHQIRRLAVLNRDQRLVGIVSLGDLAVETGDEKLAAETLEQVSEPAPPSTGPRPRAQPAPAHAQPVDPEAEALEGVGKDQPGADQHRLKDVLPELKGVAQKVGGFRQLAEIAETLDQPKE